MKLKQRNKELKLNDNPQHRKAWPWGTWEEDSVCCGRGWGRGEASPKKEGSFALTPQLHFVLFTYRKRKQEKIQKEERKKKE
ncbi:hypothetical protein ACRRTK_013594 [Alexandromys fortis]